MLFFQCSPLPPEDSDFPPLSYTKMKVPGYIEGPYGRFPPHVKQSRTADSVDFESDVAESGGSEVHRSKIRKTLPRPGRAERVLIPASKSTNWSVTPVKPLDIDLLQDAIDSPGGIASPVMMADQRVPYDAEVAVLPPSRPTTFFSKMPVSFHHVHVQLTPQNHIPTGLFLEACHEFPRILDLMGSRAFAPVKADIMNNVTKLRTYHVAAPDATATLQELVLHERHQPAAHRPSPTEALLWLKRSLTFIDVFLLELLTHPHKEPQECANIAYKASLHPHHNFVVRSVSWAALYAVPARKGFLLALAEHKTDAEDPLFMASLMEDARAYSAALHGVVSVLNDFYLVEKLG